MTWDPDGIDECQQVTLDEYASVLFRKRSTIQDAWICAEEELQVAQMIGDEAEECKLVMHEGTMVWACVMDSEETPSGANWQKVELDEAREAHYAMLRETEAILWRPKEPPASEQGKPPRTWSYSSQIGSHMELE
eukprot:CAMPEP_0183378138 /NCGR_PEP_ID=MMETSP0164_2-20130417/124756_1 /TAXON_ID=221442 /ORGANISM="Coccolithus pelagicus ssp braarudi, Strain PLY182g" /LENGTH=134 /DNA_ID=CAMNT_0025555681 /DNA_START=167 /DNA_END=571 /DNA_ORIENTATION=-